MRHRITRKKKEEGVILETAKFEEYQVKNRRSQRPRVVRRRSAASRLQRLRVRIPPGARCLSVVSVACCRCKSLRRTDHSSRGVLPTVVRLCAWKETSRLRRSWSTLGRSTTEIKNQLLSGRQERSKMVWAPNWGWIETWRLGNYEKQELRGAGKRKA